MSLSLCHPLFLSLLVRIFAFSSPHIIIHIYLLVNIAWLILSFAILLIIKLAFLLSLDFLELIFF